MKLVGHLIKAICGAGVFNPDVQVAPACILWPDRDRQWEAVIPLLRTELPELLILGDYAPEERTGPAIWLRCAIARAIADVQLPTDRAPILYLPGVSRQDLRVVEGCPDHLKPLVELQFRGTIWSQGNGKDWTILAFLKSDQGGLGLDVAQDSEAKNGMQLALHRVLEEDLDLLRGKRLDKDYFNTLLMGGDPVRDVLQWLDQGDGFRSGRSESEWRAFVEVCKSQLAFDPQKEGVLAGAAKLAEHSGPWSAVWERFCEAPKRYRSIPGQIRKCKPPSHTPLWFMSTGPYQGWPQWNEEQETSLLQELQGLAQVPSHAARKKLLEIEQRHGHRRELVWAELGEAPLARALRHLATLAEVTSHSLAAGTADDLAVGYLGNGWRADDALIRALAEVDRPAEQEAVTTAIRSMYIPWAEESARRLQQVVNETSYPGGTIASAKPMHSEAGECILFVDGLRLDVAKRLEALLADSGLVLETRPIWGALPSITATGKPAVSPVRHLVRGDQATNDFEPSVAATGQSLRGGYHLKKLLTDHGWIVLARGEKEDGRGNAWCEFGSIDHEGHDGCWKLARHLDELIRQIHDRILGLLDSGWKQVRVVTDHGWLLMPGGLPNIALPSVLTENTWGRCAALKQGAATEERLFPWFWNPDEKVALADGISCYKRGEEYSHGGLSLQECLTLELLVSRNASAVPPGAVEFTDIVWKGLRCTIAVHGDYQRLSFDIRLEPGNPTTSVVLSAKSFKGNGTASVVVEDEELEGKEAWLVLLGSGDELVAQHATVIGGAPS